MQHKTLRLSRPIGKTLGLSLVFFFLILAAVEMAARAEQFQSIFVPPGMGSNHYELGRKLTMLETVSKQQPPIDCIIIGNSMVDVGFDPQAFAAGYQRLAGQEIRCFNFGIVALPAAGAGALAAILVEDFEPGLLIYGTDARDYSVAREAEDTTVVLDSDWVRYRSGHFTLAGWLLEHSYLYRYRAIPAHLARFNFEDTLRSEQKLNFEMTPYGFTPYSTVGTFMHDPPDPQDNSFQIDYYFSLFSNYELRTENLAGLEQIINRKTPGSQVIIVEMPVPDGYFYFFDNGKDDYQRFIDQTNDLANAGNALFLQTTARRMIPDDGWVDYSHLNTKGAWAFSHWLGEQVAEATSPEGMISVE